MSYGIVLVGVRESGRRAKVREPATAVSLRDQAREIRAYKEALKLLAGVFFLWTGSSAVFTGLRTSFQAADLPTGILATGAIIAHFGFRSIFAVLGVTMVCDLALLLAIDECSARRQVQGANPVSVFRGVAA